VRARPTTTRLQRPASPRLATPETPRPRRPSLRQACDCDSASKPCCRRARPAR
jgi:hypothetical protein